MISHLQQGIEKGNVKSNTGGLWERVEERRVPIQSLQGLLQSEASGDTYVIVYVCARSSSPGGRRYKYMNNTRSLA